MLTRIISIILICSLILVPTSVFASSGPGAPWDATYNWYNVGSDGSGDMNNGNVLYGLSQMSRSLMWIGQWIYSNNSTVQSIYNLLSSSNFFQYVTQYLSSMATDTSIISTRLNNIYSLMQTDSSLQTSQLTTLQQINTKLDTVNSVKWTNTYTSYSGLSSDNINFDNSHGVYVGADTVYCRIYGDYRLTSDTIFHVVLPIQVSSPIYLQSINILFSNSLNNDVNIIYYKCNTLQTDVYFTVNRSSYFIYLTFQFNFIRASRIINTSNDVNVSLKYMLESDPNYYEVLNTLADLYYLDQISNKLDNIEVSVNTTDIVDAINALDITQDMDIDISQDVTQTTNLITQLRNLFGTGVTIPQFVQQTQDQSLLGWFSQSNSDNINHISTGYNEAPY